MAQDQVTFTVNDIVKEYSEKDAAPSRPEPRTETFFEFQIGEATINQAKKGYLQVSLKCNALDGNGATMFTKFMNIALPVAFKGTSPGQWAKGMWTDRMKALLSETAPYDDVQEDAATGKKIYLKGGVPVAGAAYDAAAKAQAKAIDGLLNQLIDPSTSDEGLTNLVGRKFFAQLITKGEYTNIEKLLCRQPKDEVVYDRKAAYGRG